MNTSMTYMGSHTLDTKRLTPQLGTYILQRERAFRTGGCVFTCDAGKEVIVSQIDESTRKVLIDFGSRKVDWFSEYTLEDFKLKEAGIQMEMKI